jgi:NAD(P)-dependent dehydrogenase (short-subunit alcohol dehydrogenase family)
MNITFCGKTAIVVGASRGIGAAIAKELLRGGCHIAFTYWDPQAFHGGAEKLEEYAAKLGVPCLSEAVNCIDEIGMARFVGRIRKEGWSVDYLVYSAGYTSPMPFADLNPTNWRQGVEINLNGAFIALHLVLPLMAAKKSGNIVLIGSAAVASGGGGRADYVSAKAGLEGLNRAVTREYAPLGIRCNLVHPSLIETDLLKQRYPDPDQRAQLARGVPLGRLGQSEDVAHLVCFLLSDQAAYITGQSIFVDGGRTFCGR